MNAISASTIQNAFQRLVTIIDTLGDTVTVRNMDTLELLHVTLSISEPEKRILSMPSRKDNIFAKIAETFWMLMGRNDIDFILPYLPRAAQFSDDGATWRGAYGPRIINWGGVNQLTNVMNLLKSDPYSRQAVISLWDPYQDWARSKDIPCNNWLHFIVRSGNVLHLSIAQRSSDAIWGFSGIDSFMWSVLLQMMAYWTGNYVGTINWFITSAHIYERHYNLIPALIDEGGNSIYNTMLDGSEWKVPNFSTSYSDFFAVTIPKVREWLEYRFRPFTADHGLWRDICEEKDDLIRAMMQAMYISHMPYSYWPMYIEQMDFTDFRLAVAMNFYQKRQNTDAAMVELDVETLAALEEVLMKH